MAELRHKCPPPTSPQRPPFLLSNKLGQRLNPTICQRSLAFGFTFFHCKVPCRPSHMRAHARTRRGWGGCLGGGVVVLGGGEDMKPVSVDNQSQRKEMQTPLCHLIVRIRQMEVAYGATVPTSGRDRHRGDGAGQLQLVCVGCGLESNPSPSPTPGKTSRRRTTTHRSGGRPLTHRGRRGRPEKLLWSPHSCSVCKGRNRRTLV